MTAVDRCAIERAYENPDAATLAELRRAHIRAREDCEEAMAAEMAARAELEEITEAYKQALLELEKLRRRKWWRR